jgi:ABC-type lipoprotein release transport system permease subunit
MNKWISPGDWLCDALGMPDGEQRVIFRMLINMIVIGGVALGVLLTILR